MNLKIINSLLYRSDRPESMKDIITFNSVLCLENDKKVIEREKQWCKDLGINFISYPMHEIKSPTSLDLIRIVKLIDEAPKAILVHCRRGIDRTGYVIAAYRMLAQGWAYKQAIEECKDNGHRTWYYFWWKKALRGIKNEYLRCKIFNTDLTDRFNS